MHSLHDIDRCGNPALRVGPLEFVDSPDDVLAFRRAVTGEELLCVFNLAEMPVDWFPPGMRAAQLIAVVGLDELSLPGTLPACSGYIASLQA